MFAFVDASTDDVREWNEYKVGFIIFLFQMKIFFFIEKKLFDKSMKFKKKIAQKISIYLFFSRNFPKFMQIHRKIENVWKSS